MTDANAKAEAHRKSVADQQVYLMTGGHEDQSLCYVLLTDFWRSNADMCQQPATHQVCVDDYRCGLTTGGKFYPAETTTRVCAEHEAAVRRGPGWRWSSPIAAGGAAA